MRDWQKILLLIIVIFICVAAFYYLTLKSFFERPPSIAKDSYLELNIYGDIPERDIVDPIDAFFGSDLPSLDVLLHCIRKAGIDPDIKGIILRPMGLRIGWGKLAELKQALRDFKQTGKPVYAYLEIGSNREYYLALEADVIFGAPQSVLFINGLLGGGYYLKGTLDKIGVEADFVVQGDYKSAPEIFTESTMTPNRRKELNHILDDFFDRYIRDMSRAREMDQEKVLTLVDRGIFSLEEAYHAELLDTLMYYDEFKKYLEEQDGHQPRLVSAEQYKKIPFSKFGIKTEGTIALIYFIGDIVSGFGSSGSEQGLIISEGMANVIRDAMENDDVEAIVMRIDSPGGSGIAADIIWDAVVEAREKKPVVVSMSDVAASGGYYIAMSADTILASENSIVGSIGVYSGKFAMKGLYQKLGIKKVEIKRGENSNLLSELSTWSPDQRQIIKDQIEKYYKDFVTKAADGRNLSYEELEALAGGRVWTGAQSVENGLVDKLGGLHDAFNVAKKMIGVTPDAYVRVLIYPERRSIVERLLSGDLDLDARVMETQIPEVLKHYLSGFFYYQDYEPLYIMPFYPEIR